MRIVATKHALSKLVEISVVNENKYVPNTYQIYIKYGHFL